MKTRTLAAIILSVAAVAPISRWVASSTASSTELDEVTFSGVVRDGDAGRPLAGAEVSLERTAHTAVTDADGRFFIVIADDAFLGTTVTLVARLAGYEEARREVRVHRASIRVEFSLTPLTVALEEMVVDNAEVQATRELSLLEG